MVPVFEITVKARPATTSNFARFKLHLRAREETLLASARFTTWERRVFWICRFDSAKGFWRRCFQSLRSRSGYRRGF